MEIFFSRDFSGGECRLGSEESSHLVRVMRHKAGDEIFVTDGAGTLYKCVLEDPSPRSAVARVVEAVPDCGAHPYNLTMAVCPTKNIDRYEWFAQKATEIGIDCIVPVIGEHSERKVFKPERIERVILSALKQSLKTKIPVVEDAISVRDFVRREASSDALKLIAHCMEGQRTSVTDALSSYKGRDIIVMIGPEGDFSRDEISSAIECGFIPVHFGDSRLRVETAALVATTAVYLDFLSK